MRLSSKSNISDVLADWKRLRKDYRKAVASGLNKAAYRISVEEMPKIMDEGVNSPVRFTRQRSAYYRKATVNNLAAFVGIKNKQAEYLRPIIFGGNATKGKAVPVVVKVNKYGNIPSLKAGKKIKDLLKAGAFAKTIGGVSGIWKRTGKRLDLLIVFSEGKYIYRRKFDWHGGVIKAAARRLPDAMNEAINKAISRNASRAIRKIL